MYALYEIIKATKSNTANAQNSFVKRLNLNNITSIGNANDSCAISLMVAKKVFVSMNEYND
jgi:hypothetical protein